MKTINIGDLKSQNTGSSVISASSVTSPTSPVKVKKYVIVNVPNYIVKQDGQSVNEPVPDQQVLQEIRNINYGSAPSR